jgi:hypothetical protein
MKHLTEYLEYALTFERMAAQETNPEVRAQFEKQAAAYRRLVADLAEKYGLPPQSRQEAARADDPRGLICRAPDRQAKEDS